MSLAIIGKEGEGEGAGAGGRMGVVRLERCMLQEKVKVLEERVLRFEKLLACDSYFESYDMHRFRV
jgi:hypothetical protein